MKKLVLLPLLFVFGMQLACGLSFPSTLVGSGEIVTIEESYDAFSAVDINHAFRANVEQGETYRVVIRVDDNLLDKVRVTKDGSVLRIGLEPDQIGGLSEVTLEADITMPELRGIEVGGASRAEITGFSSSDTLVVDVSGASSLFGDIEAGDTSVNASGAGRVELAGRGGDLLLDASGGSSVDLSQYPVFDATIDLSGASSASIFVEGTLNASASGASNVKYLGDPTLGSVVTTGASSIRPE